MSDSVARGVRYVKENRLTVFATVGVLLGISLIDFVMRVGVFRDQQARVVRIPQSQTVPAITAREVVEQRLLTALPPVAEGGGAGESAVQKQIKLLAVFRSPAGATAVVQLTAPDSQETPIMQVVRVGDQLEGWAVESIKPRHLLLRRDGEEQELVLFRGKEP
jgi:hypothetical protein